MKLNIRNAGAWRAKVFVNGAEVPRCFEADEEAGIAKCHTATGNGMEILRGVVEIRFDTPERRAAMEAQVAQ